MAALADPVTQPGWLASLTPAIAVDHVVETPTAARGKVHTFNGLNPISAARRFGRVQNVQDLVATARNTPAHASPIAGPSFGDIYGPTLPPGASSGPVPASVEDMMRQQTDAASSPKDQQGTQPQSNPQPQNQAPQQGPAPQQSVPQQNPAPQPNAQQPQPEAQPAGVPVPDESSQIPDRIDPSALAALPSLSTMYNPDGTRKSPQQQATDRTARDMVDLPTALADNNSGTTSLGGGGTVEKTITATTDGWQTNTTVTLANGFTTTFTNNNTGIDIEQLPNGRTATTLSYGDAATQARTELGRVQQQMLDQNKPNATTKPTSVFGSGINDAGDARQLVEALDRLTSNPNAPITVIKDKNGRITSLTVLAADGSEHVLVLNAGGISYDQETQRYFEFYRRPDGTVRTPDGYRIVELNGERIRVDDSGAPVQPNNPAAEEARVFGSNGVRTDRPHGASFVPPPLSTPDYGPSSSIPSDRPQPDGPLRYPVSPNTTGPFVVELPNGDLAAISEIQVPDGVSAQHMYKVEGGGLLVENGTGLHWATDPGRPPTPEETGKAITNAIAETIIWTAAGEGLSYLAVRAGTRVLPKIAEILARNAGKAASEATTAASRLATDAAAPDITSAGAALRPAAVPDAATTAGARPAANDVVPLTQQTSQPAIPKSAAGQAAAPTARSLETEVSIRTRNGAPSLENPRSIPDSPVTGLPRQNNLIGAAENEITSPSFMAKARPSPYEGVAPAPESIRLGTVRMEEHPSFPTITAEMERLGYPLRIEDYAGQSPRVVRNAIVDKEKNIVGFEQYVRGIRGMRFLDLEHEFGHLDQILYRFGDNPPIHGRIQRIPGKQFDRNLPYTPGDYTSRQDKIAEIHIRLKEYLWLVNRGASKDILDEQATLVEEGWDSYRGVVYARGSKATLDKAWAEDYFPDMDFLVFMYERSGRILKGRMQ
ncbi:hypothetical protein [Nocardia sp. NPDC020380]|uniref:hypothetical protein n=1 Tax=Nocardia sp. NPDC020380 TaxID=3364309 RepID=UPI0037B9EA35